jgi:hypothetical protein
LQFLQDASTKKNHFSFFLSFFIVVVVAGVIDMAIPARHLEEKESNLSVILPLMHCVIVVVVVGSGGWC